ncbi:SseB family protein [Nocardioides bigeumensis]|uniref:SseB protein N-terminal domain-containing protein n=1 Tax=Nocardioides bigeumensis TaxID=433657 RepID=A0ABP5JSE6_9ACTN
MEPRFEGTTVPDPGFAGDEGVADPALVEALAAYAGAPDDPATYAAALTALASSRLLVPVVAILGDSEVDEAGLTHDKSSEMAAVLLTGRDGRQALLAFTGLNALSRWRGDARPVPVTARDAGRSALAEGADALMVDLAGPVPLAVEGRLLRALAGTPPELGDQGADLR